MTSGGSGDHHRVLRQSLLPSLDDRRRMGPSGSCRIDRRSQLGTNPMNQEPKFSEQQAAFLDWCINGSGSAVLVAVAGAGKTTVLRAAAKSMKGSVAILAYNKKIADEIAGKLRDDGVDWKKARAGTVHSFGLGAYRRAYPEVIIAEHKVAKITDISIKVTDALDEFRDMVNKLVSLAKQRALGVIGSIEDDSEWYAIANHFDIFGDSEEVPREDIIQRAKETLVKSNTDRDFIDFDDMVYLPVYLKLSFYQQDVVAIDEAQDTNPARRALVRALVKKGGRVIAVGDPRQAIYGFTGADNDALDLIRDDFNCVELPLTTTFRCPKAVVEFANKWVSHIEADETAPEGSVTSIDMKAFLERNDLNGEAAVLCRTTKPLVSLALQLIRRSIACKVEGRDITASLKKLCLRWKVKNTEELEDRLEAYLAKETTKLLAAKKETLLAVVEDTVETIRVIIDQCRTEAKEDVKDVIDYIDRLFADTEYMKGILILSTIHRSKGREWETVFWLDRANTCPSKWARQQWQIDQENNLCYVAATRAKNALVEIVVPKQPKK